MRETKTNYIFRGHHGAVEQRQTVGAIVVFELEEVIICIYFHFLALLDKVSGVEYRH